MASLRQIEANRRNSQRSTGPRTPEGKAASRFNALKSGISAKAQVIPGEDPAELQALADGYTREWAPQTYLERFLIDSLVRADWLLRRLSRLEAELWTHEIEATRALTFSTLDEDSPIGDVYSRNCEAFTRLQRRIDSTERSYYRALTQLRRLRQGPGDSDVDGRGPAPDRVPLPPAPPPEAASVCPNEACPNEANSQKLAGRTSPIVPSAYPLEPHGRRGVFRFTKAEDVVTLAARTCKQGQEVGGVFADFGLQGLLLS